LFGPIKSENDYVDCKILSALYDSAVDFVVTEDVGLLKRATAIGFADTCLSVRDALVVLENTQWLKKSESVFIEDVFCAELNPNDPIFGSLKSDYAGFDDWFRKCVRTNRRAWVVKGEEAYAGLVIFNEEDPTGADKGVIGEKILKLCTFKVAEFTRGSRLGELFLRKALWYAHNNKYEAVYYTAYPKQTALIALSLSVGFESVGERPNGEQTLCRVMSKPKTSNANLLDIASKNFPYVPKFSTDGIIIPIRHQFHSTLFPEGSAMASGTTGDLFDETWASSSNIQKSPSASLRKAYLCTASKTNIPSGTPIIFYMTKNDRLRYSQRATAFGIVEQYFLATDISEILKVARLRSVFSSYELENMLNEKGYLRVLKFLFVGYLKEPASIRELVDVGVCKSHPQSIATVDGVKLSSLIQNIGLSHRPTL
jgi:L-amino acid N-acyltransferase YncA